MDPDDVFIGDDEEWSEQELNVVLIGEGVDQFNINQSNHHEYEDELTALVWNVPEEDECDEPDRDGEAAP